MIICFREVLPQEKKSRLATKGIDSIILNESCWCSCFGWETSERCCKGEWCYSHAIRAIRQEIRATSDTICRPVYATTQIFTDEEERMLSDCLLRATKLIPTAFLGKQPGHPKIHVETYSDCVYQCRKQRK